MKPQHTFTNKKGSFQIEYDTIGMLDHHTGAPEENKALTSKKLSIEPIVRTTFSKFATFMHTPKEKSVGCSSMKRGERSGDFEQLQ